MQNINQGNTISIGVELIRYLPLHKHIIVNHNLNEL